MRARPPNRRILNIAAWPLALDWNRAIVSISLFVLSSVWGTLARPDQAERPSSARPRRPPPQRVLGRPPPHEPPGTSGGKLRRSEPHDVELPLLRSATRDPADGHAVERHRRDRLRAALPQIVVDPPLDDAEKGRRAGTLGMAGIMALPLAARRLPLAQRVARLQRPPGPPMRQLHRPLHLGVRNAVGRAFVEGHGDVDAHLRLDLDRRFRREEVRRAVEVTAELDPLLPDLADAGQGNDLDPSPIRRDGPVPAHAAVHAPELLQQVRPRAEHEVVSVVEDDLGTECRLLAAGR